MNLNFCNNAHDEIVYAGRCCPVCVRDYDIFHLKGTIAELKGGLETLKEKLEKLKEGGDAFSRT